MRSARIYVDTPLQSGARLELDQDSNHYLGNVLRLRDGDPVNIFNGREGEYEARLCAVSRKQSALQLGDCIRPQDGEALTLNLGIGLSRGDRLDFAIQKSTEMGVTSITPIASEYCELRFKQNSRLENKLRHWRRIAISACEQSGRLTIPVIESPVEFANWCDDRSEALNLIAAPGPGRVPAMELQPASISLLIGPEGGFSPEELNRAIESGIVAMSLGPRILRTETAPVAALALLQYRFGDLRDESPVGPG